MTHVRKDLRDAVKAALDAAKPTGWTVAADRGRMPDAIGFPCVTIGFAMESAERRGRPDKPDMRTIRLEATIFVAGASIDDALDDGCAWVEKALGADPTFGRVAEDSIYRETRLDIFTGGDQPAGRAVIACDIRAAKALATF